ncbi:MAG: carbohydrate binding domain-containing protein [Patescibacteria group bacterium]
MKKLLVPFLIIAALLTFVRIGFALSGPTVSKANLKQLLADGDMEMAGTASWSTLNIIVSKQTANPHSGSQVIRNTCDGVNGTGGSFQQVLTVGKKYRVTGWARSDGSAVPYILVGGGTLDWSGTNSTSWQRIDITAVSNGVRLYLWTGSLTASHYVEFDDIMITEYAGFIQNQELQKLSNGDFENVNAAPAFVDGDMEQAGTGSWTASTATLTKEVGARTGGTGAQILRVAANGNTFGYASQASAVINGHTYHITGWFRGDGANAYPILYGGGTGYAVGTTSNSWQYFDATAVQTNNNSINPFCSMPGSVGYCEFDDVGIVDVTATGWSTYQSILSLQTSSVHAGKQSIRVTPTISGAEADAIQTILTVGKNYKVTGFARCDGTSARIPKIFIGGGDIAWTGTNSSTWQPINGTANAESTSFYLYTTGPAGGWCEFDDIFVTEDEGKVQMADKQVVVDGDMEKSGTANWSPGSSGATLTKSTASPHSGSQALRVAWAAGTYAYASNGDIFTAGRTYRMTGWVRSDGTVTPIISLSGGQTVWTGTTATSWQRIDITFKANYTALYLIYYASSAAWMEWDDLFATAVLK